MDEGHIFHYEFHEHESGTFDLYLDCVRGDTMKVEPDPVPEDYEGVEEQIKLAKVYLFAVEIEDSLTMNVITEALLQSIWKPRSHGDLIPPHPDLVEIIWGKTVYSMFSFSQNKAVQVLGLSQQTFTWVSRATQ